MFTDEFITDEMVGFFGAATETTHNTFQTILTYLMRTKPSLERMRDEYTQVLGQRIKEDPDLAKAPMTKQLSEVVTVENAFEL